MLLVNRTEGDNLRSTVEVPLSGHLICQQKMAIRGRLLFKASFT